MLLKARLADPAISPSFYSYSTATRRNTITMSKKKPLKRNLRKSELAEERQARLSIALEHDPNLREELELQLDAFRQKFGRDPAPGDPLFFDPEKDEPTLMSEDAHCTINAELIEGLVKMGRPEFGYAYARSGYLVSEDNQDLIPEEGLRDWHGAIREWSEMSAADRATAIQGLVARRRQ
jgi:hypothetical protein